MLIIYKAYIRSSGCAWLCFPISRAQFLFPIFYLIIPCLLPPAFIYNSAQILTSKVADVRSSAGAPSLVFMHQAHKQTLVGGRIISTFTPTLPTTPVKYWFFSPHHLGAKHRLLFSKWLIKVMGSRAGLNYSRAFAVSSHLDGVWKLEPNKNVTK